MLMLWKGSRLKATFLTPSPSDATQHLLKEQAVILHKAQNSPKKLGWFLWLSTYIMKWSVWWVLIHSYYNIIDHILYSVCILHISGLFILCPKVYTSIPFACIAQPKHISPLATTHLFSVHMSLFSFCFVYLFVLSLDRIIFLMEPAEVFCYH